MGNPQASIGDEAAAKAVGADAFVSGYAMATTFAFWAAAVSPSIHEPASTESLCPRFPCRSAPADS